MFPFFSVTFCRWLCFASTAASLIAWNVSRDIFQAFLGHLAFRKKRLTIWSADLTIYASDRSRFRATDSDIRGVPTKMELGISARGSFFAFWILFHVLPQPFPSQHDFHMVRPAVVRLRDQGSSPKFVQFFLFHYKTTIKLNIEVVDI